MEQNNNLTLIETPRTTTDLNIPYKWSQTDRVIRVSVNLKKEGIHGTLFIQNGLVFQYNRQTVENLSGELAYPINAEYSCSHRQDDDTVLIVIYKKNEGQVWEKLFKRG